MAPVPAGQPGVRQPGAGPGARPPRRRRLGEALLAVLALGTALGLADAAGVAGPGSIRETAASTAGAALVLALCGLGVTRLALPAGLRRHELLYVPAVGACVLALALGALGYAYVPYPVALVLVLAGAALLAAVALRRTGLPALGDRRALAWPVLLTALGIAIAMVPMLRAGFATVIGNGSDSHLAVGTAQFLQAGHHPLAVVPEAPLDQVFPLWRSKTPIYYAFAAVSSLTGLEPYETIAGLSALLMGLAALGFFLLARERLGASVGAASVALALLVLDRSVLHTAMHPYFNQTWGFMALPYVLVLARPAVLGEGRGARPLCALFLVVLALAYPLALPIPAAALAATWALERRRRGLPLRPRGLWRRVYKRPRSLLWILPAGWLALIPVLGVLEKSQSALQVMAPGSDLGAWGGDLLTWMPWEWFAAAGSQRALWLVVPLMAVGVVAALRGAPRDVQVGVGAVLLFGALFAAYFRVRDGGWYFHFKVLAFTAPLAITCAAVGLARLRVLGVVALALWISTARWGTQQELVLTYDQLPKAVLEVRDVLPLVPAGASVRLDVPPNEQLWLGNLLAARRLCSQRPLLGTSYPHVQVGRRADFVLGRGPSRPADTGGPPLLRLEQYTLWRQLPTTPGRDRCSQRMVQRVTDPTT